MIRYRTQHMQHRLGLDATHETFDCGTCDGAACESCEPVMIPEDREDELELEVWDLKERLEAQEADHKSEVSLLEQQRDTYSEKYHDLRERVDEVVEPGMWEGPHTTLSAKGMYRDIVGTLLR